MPLLTRQPVATSTTWARDPDQTQTVYETPRTDNFRQVKGDFAKKDSGSSEIANPKHVTSTMNYIDDLLHLQHVVHTNEQAANMQLIMRPQVDNEEWQALFSPPMDGQLECAHWDIGRSNDSIPTAAFYHNTETSVGLPVDPSLPLLYPLATPQYVLSQSMLQLHHPSADVRLA